MVIPTTNKSGDIKVINSTISEDGKKLTIEITIPKNQKKGSYEFEISGPPYENLKTKSFTISVISP